MIHSRCLREPADRGAWVWRVSDAAALERALLLSLSAGTRPLNRAATADTDQIQPCRGHLAILIPQSSCLSEATERRQQDEDGGKARPETTP